MPPPQKQHHHVLRAASVWELVLTGWLSASDNHYFTLRLRHPCCFVNCIVLWLRKLGNCKQHTNHIDLQLKSLYYSTTASPMLLVNCSVLWLTNLGNCKLHWKHWFTQCNYYDIGISSISNLIQQNDCVTPHMETWDWTTKSQGCGRFSRHSPDLRAVKNIHSPNQKTTRNRSRKSKLEKKKKAWQPGEWTFSFTRQVWILLAFGELASGFLHPWVMGWLAEN
jgi:hypothetical protein